MKIHQAVVESTSARSQSRNRLLASSLDLGQQATEQLCRWCPGRSDLVLGCADSFLCFPMEENRFALGRSYIGPEDRLAGHRSIISHLVIFDRHQIEGYQWNVALLMHVLNSMGILYLNLNLSEKLPRLSIPDKTFLPARSYVRDDTVEESERLAHAIEVHHRVAILGLKDPLDYLCGVLAKFPESSRLQSFAAGMKIDDERPFTIHFFRESDAQLEKEFASRQLRTISYACRFAKV